MHFTGFLTNLSLAFFAFAGAVSALAVVSPRHFEWLARKSSRWVDSRRFVEVLDRRIEVDHYFLPHSRVFGLCMLASVSVLTYLCLAR
jgi:hypothetical protein